MCEVSGFAYLGINSALFFRQCSNVDQINGNFANTKIPCPAPSPCFVPDFPYANMLSLITLIPYAYLNVSQLVLWLPF